MPINKETIKLSYWYSYSMEYYRVFKRIPRVK